MHQLTRSLAESEISSHSGLTNSYFPSIMFLNITSCFRCQKGGKPTNLCTTHMAHWRRNIMI